MPLSKKEIAEVDALVALQVAEWEKDYAPRLEAAFAQANAAEDPMSEEEFLALRDSLRSGLRPLKK